MFTQFFLAIFCHLQYCLLPQQSTTGMAPQVSGAVHLPSASGSYQTARFELSEISACERYYLGCQNVQS